MSRRHSAEKREIIPDAKYGDVTLTKFMNSIMYDGKKSTAEAIVYGAFENIEQRLRTEPLPVFMQALDNVAPAIEVRSRRVGGATYQVPVEIPAGQREAFHESYPGSGDKDVPIAAPVWQTVTEGMAAATTGNGTAFASHLEGIDFAGKTGTAQVMSHDALARTGKSKKTQPNSWFVGMAPRRNPDIVVAVLWENGDWGSNSAKLAAQVIDAFVEKQRKREGNLLIAKAPAAPEPAKAGIGGGDEPVSTAPKPPGDNIKKATTISEQGSKPTPHRAALVELPGRVSSARYPGETRPTRITAQ